MIAPKEKALYEAIASNYLCPLYSSIVYGKLVYSASFKKVCWHHKCCVNSIRTFNVDERVLKELSAISTFTSFSS